MFVIYSWSYFKGKKPISDDINQNEKWCYHSTSTIIQPFNSKFKFQIYNISATLEIDRWSVSPIVLAQKILNNDRKSHFDMRRGRSWWSSITMFPWEFSAVGQSFIKISLSILELRKKSLSGVTIHISPRVQAA